jgi:hypothetical protein
MKYTDKVAVLTSGAGSIWTNAATFGTALVRSDAAAVSDSCKDPNCIVCINTASARCELCEIGFVWSFTAKACL